MGEMAYHTYLRFKLVLEKLQEKDMSTHELKNVTKIKPSTIYKIMNELNTNGVVRVVKYRMSAKGSPHKETVWGLTEDGKTSIS